MTLFLSTLAVAFAALCVWLTVRIVNRRERWAKWTLAVAIALVYPASFGPWYYVAARLGMGSPRIERTGWIYVPLNVAGDYLLHDPFHEYRVWWVQQGLFDRIRLMRPERDPTAPDFDFQVPPSYATEPIDH
jgi:hypothetical protein